MKKSNFLLLLILLLYSGQSVSGQSIPALIPMPQEYKPGTGSFSLKPGSAIQLPAQTAEWRTMSKQIIEHPLLKAYRLTLRPGTPGAIRLELATGPAKEGYHLSVKHNGITIKGSSPAGIFYGIQTLAQLAATSSGQESGKIPICEINDQPRYSWRGIMLDVSRHFFSVDEVKTFIDAMVLYKFNTLHLHLTDDNGWRLEIKSLPRLTSVGAWRAERHGTWGDRAPVKENEPTPYGGFYTHAQIRELVAYAASKQITIVPEIETPGHAMALLAAYPELSCTQEKVFVDPGTAFAEWFGDGTFKMLKDNTLDPSNELVYEYLDKIFTEVAALFPNPYIHIGGDECYHGYWEKDESCQALMAKEGLKNTHELQSYFVKRCEKIIKSKGKKLLGWDEILEGGLAPEATVMSWRGMKGGIEAAKMGHDVVMTPTTFAYIDYMQGDRSIEFPVYASLSLQKSYSFEPTPEEVDAKYILGGQGNLWSEKTPTLRHVFYMVYPRAFALAETFWSPRDKKNWIDFSRRTEHHFGLFDRLQWNIARSLYDAVASTKKENNLLKCMLATELPGGSVHYTLDNTFPDAWSPRYKEPITIPEGDVTLRFVVVKDGKIMGRMGAIHRKELMDRSK
jgi:hexosaminidase